MKMSEREILVLDALKNNEKLGIEDIASILGISESSVRRLVKFMGKNGKIIHIYGGIQRAPTTSTIYSFTEFEKKHILEKRAIAKCAAKFLKEKDAIYLDSGTTLFQLAIAIKESIINGELHDIRVITNSFANMEVLNEVCEVIIIGGKYISKRKAFEGFAAERFLQGFNYNKAFLGADGFDMKEGFMGTDTETTRLNEILIPRSDEVFVLINSHKIGIRSFVSYSSINQIKTIITDSNISPKIAKEFNNMNISLIIADP
jgi:DeoR/GlpR family transcriptional regulator of sugar metabolism